MRKMLNLILATSTLVACTAGPDYSGPPVISSAADHPEFVRAAPDVAADQPALASWWLLLDDAALTQLIEQALADNPGMAAAQARIAQARSSIRQEQVSRLPVVGAQATVIQAQVPGLDIQQGPPAQPGEEETQDQDDRIGLYNLGLSANWELDFAGGTRRRIEAANAQAAASIANADDARLQLTAEVARAYVNLREVQARSEALRAQQQQQEEILRLTYQSYQQGTLPLLPVGTENGELELINARLATAEADEAIFLDALAVLTGRVPGTVTPEMLGSAGVPLPPVEVAVGDPAGLISRRPDIRAAERNLAAAYARIGVAEAARFPKLSFMGILGLGGSSPEDVFDPANLAPIAIPRLEWNFLDFGRARTGVDRAEAARDEAEANYRQIVLASLQDAERALARFAQQRANVTALARIKQQADGAADLNRQRSAAGTISRIDLNRSLRQQEQAEADLQGGTAALTLAWIALQKSLGLGWQENATSATH